MKPNILFISIDGLRADRCFGSNHYAHTPNIDNLKENSVCFTQMYGTSTITGTSLGCTFSSQLPFNTGTTLFYINKEIPTIFDILKENGYSLHSTLPDTTWFRQLTEKFDDAYFYDVLDDETRDTIFGVIGNKIIKKLDSLNSNWVYYIHLSELHLPVAFDAQFNDTKFGINGYDKAFSCIDFWIGKFLKKIDLSNTLLVITSDHGEIVPKIEYTTPLLKTKKIMRFMKHKMPFLEPIGVKIYEKMTMRAHARRIKKDSKGLTKFEKRTLITRGLVDLVHDELIHIPLIIHVPRLSGKQISELTRQIDTCPTILEFLKLKFHNNIDGRSLMKLIQGSSLEELPAYLESGSNKPNVLGKYIGIRTSKFKYMRARDENTSEVFLYDLINDPSEQNNLAEMQIATVKYHERILQNILNSSAIQLSQIKNNQSPETHQKIIEELKKLGYL